MFNLQELEASATVMMASPTAITPQQRHEAEQVFMKLRKSKSPYAFCKQVLEQSDNDYVMFQAASAIKDAVLREWSLLAKEDIESLRTFLLAFVLQKQGVQKYVKEQVLQVVAVMFKRGSLDGNQEAWMSLFHDLTQLITGSDTTMQILGCSILKALLNEFSFINRSSDIGLSWEFHTRCKHTFETNHLKEAFCLVIQVLQRFETIDAKSLTREQLVALVRFLSLAEQILHWEHTIYNSIMNRKNPQINRVILLRPDKTWRNVLFDPALISIFFNILSKYQDNEELAHHGYQCLIQLASLSGPIVVNKAEQMQYLAHFLGSFNNLVNSLKMTSQVALGLSSVTNRLFTVFPTSCITSLPMELLLTTIRIITDLTCNFLEAVTKEEELHTEDTSYMEAVEHILESWGTLLAHTQSFPAHFFDQSAFKILNVYVRCHLAVPDGLRGSFSPDSQGLHMDEICDLEGDDRELFSDQLCSIGGFARLTVQHSLPLLTNLIETRVQKFKQCLQGLQHAKGSPIHHVQSMDSLFEDLHWLILIAGHMIADESTGETPLIPSEIVLYSIAHEQKTDIQCTLDHLIASHRGETGYPSTIDQLKVEPVIKIISAILHLADTENKALSSNMAHCMSPQVGSTVVWFLRHFSKSYLLPNEHEYDQLSTTLSSIFGQDSDGGKWTIGFLLDKVRTNLTYWSSEPALAEDTVLLLLSLVDSKHRAEVAISFECLWQIGEQHAAGHGPISQMPCEAHRYLVQALVLAGSSRESHPMREKYWNQFLQSLHTRFTNVCQQPNFIKIAQDEQVKCEIQNLLESFRGVALASSTWNTNELFKFLLPVLRDSVTLLKVYQECPEVSVLVLEMYVDVVEAQITFLEVTEAEKLYKVCLLLLETYAKCSLGKHNYSSLAEEEQFSDLYLLMKLLSHILSKDILDFAEEEGRTSAADVTIYGLNIIIPLISNEILKFPSICEEYFKLTTYVCDVYPEKTMTLPDGLFQNMMSTLEVGLNNYDADITKMSMESLAALAAYLFNQNKQTQEHRVVEVIRHFLRVIFNMLLLESFNMDLLQPASEAFLALICCNQGYYSELVRDLLAQQSDPVVTQRLLAAFNTLTPSDMRISLDKTSKTRFRRSLDSFLANVKGFLFTK